GALVGFFFGFFLAAQLLQISQVTPPNNQVLVVLLLAVACAILGWLGAPYATVMPMAWIQARIRATAASDLAAGVFGGGVGLVLALFLAFPLSLLPGELGRFAPLVRAVGLRLPRVHVEIDDEDPAGDGADGKLVALARARHIPIVTNDYGLNRVAELHGVTVLNVNDLAKAVRPVVLPGEEIHVRIIQEGKEAGQGVGYLEDGTMIVVENGARSVGNEIPVTVMRVLQTVGGRMIFAQPRGEGAETRRPRAVH